jgi:hypothetical protein
MPGTELDEVQALLERVRPDPTGFAQRLLVQVMTRFGDMPEPDPTIFYAADDEPAITVPAEPMFYPDSDSDSGPGPGIEVDTNLLLAAALGACRCWGLRADCEVCVGRGCTGWVRPDRELFDELVQPAVARMHDRPSEKEEER